MILFPDSQSGVLIMANSDNIFKKLPEYATGCKYTPWYRENCMPYDQK
ncbi:hypothetical protein [Hufsiella ginkgonis]|uniref:Uncharacterized protein n=1 Tax=Hufsiella ginkgonis TaxID=2695274 RepID=A0A7K1XZM0_9SPHI|nr:hypothetical protein [Hufsiella ginkgonis]MXV16465.1 hypothetical protein [Hufsiella ginkgonis]